MYSSQDYRLCVKLSLQIMNDQRNELCNKSKSPAQGIAIYMALHEMNSQIRSLRFQYSLVEWLDSHWENLQSRLNCNQEYTIDQRKQITLFFAEYFSKLLDNVKADGIFSKLGIPDLLAMQKAILSDLISTGEKWEEKSQLLRYQMIKHEEEYRNLISECNQDETKKG